MQFSDVTLIDEPGPKFKTGKPMAEQITMSRHMFLHCSLFRTGNLGV
jgi:hypothetical protein